jgi:hypothetical protein
MGVYKYGNLGGAVAGVRELLACAGCRTAFQLEIREKNR